MNQVLLCVCSFSLCLRTHLGPVVYVWFQSGHDRDRRSESGHIINNFMCAVSVLACQRTHLGHAMYVWFQSGHDRVGLGIYLCESCDVAYICVWF